MHHADKFIDRIIFLEGHPNLQTLDPLRIGETPKETLECDLAGELDAIALYKEARDHCVKVNDYVSKNLFEELLTDEEGHTDFLETQLDLHRPHRRGELVPAQRAADRRGRVAGRGWRPPPGRSMLGRRRGQHRVEGMKARVKWAGSARSSARPRAGTR